ncbi:MAG TPA: hypothetical protein PKH64_02245 [Petrotogaceae bacterium]|jgi:hypothetical protein|nr:hypothetical protein [Petrotogaceae bacterium]HNV04918.1 hypothetical protein [Petrotogaceae bacterium]HNY37575.1 hypothetical protein [Petrotogaceae bacterium]HOG34871.1 hypothetical protein [Petrotogaceae bacterium]HPA92716.1 hypothetical protein [Petrotogaceae bacterium]
MNNFDKQELLKRKRVLEIEKNAIAKYMGPYEHDDFLEEEWKKINDELLELDEKLKTL